MISRDEWTYDRDAMLIKLRSEGMKRGEIADHINFQTGSAFTRSAVCGRIDRLFLANKSRRTPEEIAATKLARYERHNDKRREETRLKRIAAGLSPEFKRPRKSKPEPALKVVFRAEEVTAENVHGIMALEDWHCRYQLNDSQSEPIFCGAHVVDGKSWCFKCCGVVFQPPQARTRRAA